MNLRQIFEIQIVVFLFTCLLFVSCGSDDSVQDDENSDVDCNTEVTFIIENEVFNFENPATSEFRFNEPSGSYEFLATWVTGEGNLSFQVLIDLQEDQCFGANQVIDMNNLPSNISLMSMQFINLNHSINASVIQDGTGGVIEINSCDSENKTMSFDFQFEGTDTFGGNLKQVTQGAVSNLCFTFT